MIFILFYSNDFSFFGIHQLSFKLSVLFLLFQITMPKCQKIYPNCLWHVPPEWFGLNFHSALFTKIYLNDGTHIVCVCVSPRYPITPQLHCSKCNLQVELGYRAMASLYELLCHHSLTKNDPLLEELLSYLPTRFPSQLLNNIAYESSNNEIIKSIDSSAFHSDDSTYFS